MRFISAYALLSIATASLCIVALQLVEIYPELSPALCIQALGLSWAFALLGAGIGLITLIIATAMGWLQVALLVTGNINPHMGESGFVKSLTIFWGILLG